jgi:hypothetical protein
MIDSGIQKLTIKIYDIQHEQYQNNSQQWPHSITLRWTCGRACYFISPIIVFTTTGRSRIEVVIINVEIIIKP